MKRPTLSLIAAVAEHGAIGFHNELLVRIPDDLKRFKRLTLGSPILMGRKTWESLGRPLPGRRNIVVTRNPAWVAEGAEAASSLDAALALVKDADRAFVIGGAQLYAEALPRVDELLLTEIDAEFDADTFFPRWDRSHFIQTAREDHTGADGLAYRFTTYVRIDFPREGN